MYIFICLLSKLTIALSSFSYVTCYWMKKQEFIQVSPASFLRNALLWTRVFNHLKYWEKPDEKSWPKQLNIDLNLVFVHVNRRKCLVIFRIFSTPLGNKQISGYFLLLLLMDSPLAPSPKYLLSPLPIASCLSLLSSFHVTFAVTLFSHIPSTSSEPLASDFWKPLPSFRLFISLAVFQCFTKQPATFSVPFIFLLAFICRRRSTAQRT